MPPGRFAQTIEQPKTKPRRRVFGSGVVLRTLIAFEKPFQVGDRVTLKGLGGKVLEIGSFFIKLQTPDDDLVSLPTYQLWSEAFISANSGDRASLCVMRSYLAPCANRHQRQQAEDVIWNAIQASVFFDFGKPLQIFLEQVVTLVVSEGAMAQRLESILTVLSRSAP